ncbi:3-hydroxyacyl-ACP dehydratase FabZ [Butyrivibrio sp. MB2005]|uniref:3-hydroxyacyl-ACP dehydratase FabZ n=1 Tax=Butyrivibrio sp. MB2005 TaxID=1280678 RepID=UPI000420C36C|nr:3-hydroxyacyl-ACP dehydratase FabZ [Butyrivibrio sp. MB2005]
MLEEVIVRDEKNVLSAEEIAEILPHRYPFALVDRILDYEPGVWAIGKKCVSMDEPFFQGHFPGKPIMPGVLIIEALAQTGAVAALSLPENKGKIALFGGIKNARFKKQVVPGDVLELRVNMLRSKGPVGVAEARALVDGNVVTRAEITFSVI